MDKLIFKGNEYELIEVDSPRYIFFSHNISSEDIATRRKEVYGPIPEWMAKSLNIKDKLYGLKFIKNEQLPTTKE